MTLNRCRLTNAPRVSSRRCVSRAAETLRRCGVWVWLLTFLFVVQAHAAHLHLPAPPTHDAAMLHAPLGVADAGIGADESTCALCVTLASTRPATHAEPLHQRTVMAWLPRARQTVAAAAPLHFDLFCRPPPVRDAAR